MPAKHHRVTRGDDYRHIVRKGNRVGGASCITHAVLHIQPESAARFGFIISKAVGNAVTRNLVRRRLKTIVDRRLAQGFSGADVVFRALPAAATISFEKLAADTNRALDHIQQLIEQSAQS